MSDEDNKTDHANTETGFDTGDATVFQKGRTLVRERPGLVVGVVLLMVVIVAMCAVLWRMYGSKPAYDTTQNTSQADSRAEEEAATRKLDRQVEDARAEELKRLIVSEADNQKKSEYSIELSLIYFNRASYDEALQHGLEAESSVKTAVTAGLLGDIYYAKKDYVQAVKQYDIAMNRSEKPASSNERSPYNDYQYLKKKAEDAQ